MALDINSILTYQFWNNTGKEYAVALLIFIILTLILKIFKMFVLRKLKTIAKKTKNDIDDFVIESVDNLHPPFYIVISLYFAVQMLHLSATIKNVLNYVLVIVVTFYAVSSLQRLIVFITQKFILKGEKDDKEHSVATINLFSTILKVILWLIALLFILSNLGYNVSSLIAGLGIGGIAIALALQNILGDIFSSFSIYFDKPFKVGDFIVLGTDMGTVKKIGIKSTRIQTLQGEELVISNKELTSARIQNFKKLKKRRIVFTIGLTYDTAPKNIKKAIEIIKGAIEKQKLAEIDRVHFKSYGDFSLNIEAVYYINSSEYIDYMNTHEAINMDIKEKFDKAKIEFAFPTQTIFVEKNK